MTETLQWSFTGRDSAEFKLLKPYLRWGGTACRQPPGKTGVPVARLIDGTPIKSGRELQVSRKLHKIERT